MGTCSTKLIKKNTRPQDSPYPNNNQTLSEIEPDEELDKNNQKQLQTIVRKFVYYDISINSTLLMALKSLVAVHTKPTIETKKQITQSLNYSATYPDAVTE